MPTSSMIRKQEVNISHIIKQPRNTTAKCKCKRVGKFQTVIQISDLRANDYKVWSCDDHKYDLEFLTI